MHVCMYLYEFVCVGMLMCVVPMHMCVYVCGDQKTTLSTVHLVFIFETRSAWPGSPQEGEAGWPSDSLTVPASSVRDHSQLFSLEL